MKIDATFEVLARPFRVETILSDMEAGSLSDEHAASSYGLPVAVGADGTAYGPAEVGRLLLVIDRSDWTADVQDLVRRARAASYSVQVADAATPGCGDYDTIDG